nr:MAG TPA: hypothetical protein [Caudoviricetes sp.]
MGLYFLAANANYLHFSSRVIYISFYREKG